MCLWNYFSWRDLRNPKAAAAAAAQAIPGIGAALLKLDGDEKEVKTSLFAPKKINNERRMPLLNCLQ
jgi:hypothetical protein